MDFRFKALSLRGSEATEAKQGEAEASLVIHKKVDSSMDRHALQSKARDDRESNNSSPTTQAAVFSSDFWGFQAAGEGILLGVNEQAHRAESTKSAEKTTREGA